MKDHADPHRGGVGLLREAARTTVRARRPVLGSALLACAGALVVGGSVVAGAFAASWGLFLQARRDAEFGIASEDSYVAYADQWDDLVRVALVVFPLLLLVAMTCVAWLLSAQAVIVAHTRRRSGGLPLRAVWDRSRGHLGAALRVQALTVACALGPALAGLAVLVAAEEELVPGVVRPTYHDPATVQFILVGRILPVLIWAGGLVLLGRFSLATAIRVADDCSATVAMRRSWTLTRAARSRTTGLWLLGLGVLAVAFTLLKWLGTYVAHGAGLLMLATTDDNVWVTGVLVLIVPVAVALVLLPLALAPVGVLPACLRERLDHDPEAARVPSWASVE